MSESSALVAKLWNYCHVLRDDGVSTIEYVEQLTYLLFLKMADERAKAGMGQVVPAGLDWQSLLDRDGDDLEVHYRHVLYGVGSAAGHVGHDLPQGPEPDPGPGEVAPAGGEPDQRGDLDRGRRGPEGRRLRGAAAEGRGGHQVRGRAVLHPPSADPGDDGLPVPQAG